MMKRIFALTLSVLLLVALSACTDGDSPGTTAPNPSLESAIQLYMEASYGLKPGSMAALAPETYWQRCETAYGMSRHVLLNAAKKAASASHDHIASQLGGEFTVTLKDIHCEYADDATLSAVAQVLASAKGIDPAAVSAACTVTFTAVFSGNGNTGSTALGSHMVCIADTWYLVTWDLSGNNPYISFLVENLAFGG